MGKHAQLVMGPAGSGKSTYCAAIQRHCEARKRYHSCADSRLILRQASPEPSALSSSSCPLSTAAVPLPASSVHCVNLDPAAEHFDYPVAIDIRDLVSLSDVMESLDYGPNGGLVYALDYLASHLSFLSNQLCDYQDDYLVLDCPGQIELYTHLPAMRDIVSHLQKEGYRVCAVWCLDSVFVTDLSRFVSGVMMCLSAMIQLELPHINVLTKCDQLADRTLVDRYTDPDMAAVLAELRAAGDRGEVVGGAGGRGGWARLNEAVSGLIEQYSMVSFVALDLQDEESVDVLLMHVDNALQYGEDVEPQEPLDEQEVDIEPGDERLG